MGRDRVPEIGNPGVRRIPGEALLNRLNAGLGGRARGIEIRLTDAEIDHVLAQRPEPPRFGIDRDGFRALDVGQIGGQRLGQSNNLGHGNAPGLEVLGEQSEGSWVAGTMSI